VARFVIPGGRAKLFLNFCTVRIVPRPLPLGIKAHVEVLLCLPQGCSFRLAATARVRFQRARAREAAVPRQVPPLLGRWSRGYGKCPDLTRAARAVRC